MNTYNIKLDLSKGYATSLGNDYGGITLRQGDKQGCTIVADLYDHGERFTKTGLTAYFVMELPDHTHYYRGSASYSNGTVTHVIDESKAASVTGDSNNAYFELCDGSTIIGSTRSIRVRVLPDARGGKTAGETYDTAIDDALSTLSAAISSANSAASNANNKASAANNAASVANAAASNANAKATDANNAAASANEAAASASEKAAAANSAAGSANTAASDANAATQAASDAAASATSAASAANTAASSATSAAATASTAAANANAAASATANVVAEAVEALSRDTGTEAAQIHVLATELANVKGGYVVIAEALYAPTSKISVSGESATCESAAASGETVTLT